MKRFGLFLLTLAFAGGSVTSYGQEPAGSAAGMAGGSSIQSQVQADVQECSGAKQKAELCCNDPMQCAEGMSPEQKQQLMQLLSMGAMGAMAYMQSGESPMNPAGIAGICGALGMLGNLGSGVNEGASQVCEQKRSTCTQACQEVAAKWKAKQQECSASNCPDLQALNSAVSSFESSQASCDSLQANVAAMQSQASNTGNAAQLGQLCAQIASLIPQKKEPQPALASTVVDCNDPAQATNPMCIDCKADPENVACGRPADTTRGGVGMADGSTLSASDFNTGAGTDGLDQGPQFGNFAAEANKSGTVTGSGGGIPGGGNNGGGFGEQPMGSATGGYKTDIMGGTRGGSGYSVSSMGVDASGGFSGYGGYQPQENDPGYQGMDLKKYLPGGDLDPSRRIAGALVNSGQINGKNANLFERISQRMQAVCKTNRLKDCQKKKN